MKMMKGITTIMLTAMAMNMAAQNFTLKGHFTDVRNDTVLISYTKREPDKQQIETKIPINADGRFSYSCDIQNAYNAQLVVQSNNSKAFFFFVPGESVEIAGPSTSDNDWVIGGSAFYQKWRETREVFLPFYKEFDAASAKYAKGMADGLDKKKLEEERDSANVDTNTRMWEVARQYILSHPDEETSATVLLRQNYTNIVPTIKKLSPKVRNGRFKVYIDGLESMFSRLAKEIEANDSADLELKEGGQSPDLTLKDINGNDFTLSSFFGKGKYVVVDFWGSWCTWCIKGFPKMKEYYHKYGGKLEIVSVACYDKEDKWKEAVSKYNLSWTNVFSSDGTTEVRFGVKGYPYKVVISPDGKVVKCFLGETDDFYRLLDEKLK